MKKKGSVRADYQKNLIEFDISMRRYLVEFEFVTLLENMYWFPFFIEASDENSAEISAKAVQTAIEQHYTLKQRSKVVLIVEGVNAEHINRYIQQRLGEHVECLEINVWRFSNIRTIPTLNFDEHLSRIELSTLQNDPTIANRISLKKFAVRQERNFNSYKDFNEFLCLNVVDPANINCLYIIVEISDAEFSNSRLKLIQEGIWKDAHISGYKVRVDPPHTPDGKRHAHIAHNKHINSKNKQVSWNNDATRHDKKTFDSNFTGLERAKEIARKELGLPIDAILEKSHPNRNFLLEDFQIGIENEISIYFRYI